jgi:poly-beta-1,6-N-acetyl-D-glucosamine biosynthesis protein PgaD
LGARAENGSGTHISDSLIIDVRARLPLRRRLGSDITTAGLWGFCAWLAVSAMVAPRHLKPVQLHPALAGISMPALNGVLGILVLAVAVLVWVRARHLKAARQPVQTIEPDYAQRFGLTQAHLVDCRATQTCVVHHNDAGEIIGIDAIAPVAVQGDVPVESQTFATAA